MDHWLKWVTRRVSYAEGVKGGGEEGGPARWPIGRRDDERGFGRGQGEVSE